VSEAELPLCKIYANPRKPNSDRILQEAKVIDEQD
jgi:hypothetical protein